jgi:hypothetical protein
MAKAPPAPQPIAPGVVTDPNKYPQWGVKLGTADASGNVPGDVKEAKNQADKLSLSNQGYLVWFGSQQAAQDFISSQQGILGGHLPNPLSGLEGIAKVLGDIGRALTDGKMWRSLGWLIAGLVIAGLGVTLWLAQTRTGKTFAEAATTAIK